MGPEDNVERISTSKAREIFADLVNRAAYGGERIIIRRHGRDIAAIVPISDLERIDPEKQSKR